MVHPEGLIPKILWISGGREYAFSHEFRMLPLTIEPTFPVNAFEHLYLSIAKAKQAITMPLDFVLPQINDNADGSWGPSTSALPAQFKE